MYGGKNESASRGQIVDASFDLLDDLRRRAEGEDMLCIDSAAPKDDVFTELLFQPMSIHTACRDLHRVEDVEAQIDQVWDQSGSCAAAMVKNLGICLLLNRLHQATMLGFDHPAVQVGTDQPAILPADIIPEGEHVQVSAELVQVVVAGFDVDIGDLVHQAIGELGFLHQGHEEVLQADRAGWLFEDAAADDGAAYQGV